MVAVTEVDVANDLANGGLEPEFIDSIVNQQDGSLVVLASDDDEVSRFFLVTVQLAQVEVAGE